MTLGREGGHPESSRWRQTKSSGLGQEVPEDTEGMLGAAVFLE